MNNFCPDCNYILELVKNIKLINVSSEEELIIKLLNNSYNLNTSITFEKIKEHKNYKSLNENKREIININYNKYLNLNKVGFLICNNCRYFQNIKNGTILISNKKNNLNINNKLYNKLQINNKILPRTKDYICQNPECITHKKNDSNKEAVFYRNTDSYVLNYICCICESNWIVS